MNEFVPGNNYKSRKYTFGLSMLLPSPAGLHECLTGLRRSDERMVRAHIAKPARMPTVDPTSERQPACSLCRNEDQPQDTGLECSSSELCLRLWPLCTTGLQACWLRPAGRRTISRQLPIVRTPLHSNSIDFSLLGQLWFEQVKPIPCPSERSRVAMLDWTTGQPNAKYYAVQMLASLGTGTKQLHNTDLTGPGAGASYALGMVVEGVRKLLLVSKSEQSQLVHVGNTTNLTVAMVLDGSIDGVTASAEPGFLPPVMRPVRDDGVLRLGPWGFALLTL